MTIGVTIESAKPRELYYLEAKVKKFEETWQLFGKNIKGFSVCLDGNL